MNNMTLSNLELFEEQLNFALIGWNKEVPIGVIEDWIEVSGITQQEFNQIKEKYDLIVDSKTGIVFTRDCI